MDEDDTARPVELYETEQVNVPSGLRKICSGLGDYVDNLDDQKKKRLSKNDLGWVRKNLEWLRTGNRTFSQLEMLNRLNQVADGLYLLKRTKGDANPRFYLTDVFPDRYLILHAYKKDSYEEDPAQQQSAEERLDDLLARSETDGGSNEHV